LPAAADAKPSGNHGKDCEADRLGLQLATLELDDAIRAEQQATVRATIGGRLFQFGVGIGDIVTVGPSSAIGAIAAPEGLAVDVEGDEREVFGIASGMPARVSPELNMAEVFDETVADSPRLKRPRSSAAGMGVFGFRVDLASGAEVPFGASVRVEVIAGRRAEVLAVPSRALIEHRGKLGVVTWTGGAGAFREIQAGVESDSMTEVLSGLSDGERVALAEPDELARLAGSPAREAAERTTTR
jgi:hypothetical protein